MTNDLNSLDKDDLFAALCLADHCVHLSGQAESEVTVGTTNLFISLDRSEITSGSAAAAAGFSVSSVYSRVLQYKQLLRVHTRLNTIT